MNNTKTELILSGHQVQLKNVLLEHTINVAGDRGERSAVIKYLGVWVEIIEFKVTCWEEKSCYAQYKEAQVNLKLPYCGSHRSRWLVQGLVISH